VRGVVGAVAYIDSRGAVHRDIKADNVLIDADDNAKLGDFGLAKKVTSPIVCCNLCNIIQYVAFRFYFSYSHFFPVSHLTTYTHNWLCTASD
jgi:serine/threonine protein kinase